MMCHLICSSRNFKSAIVVSLQLIKLKQLVFFYTTIAVSFLNNIRCGTKNSILNSLLIAQAFSLSKFRLSKAGQWLFNPIRWLPAEQE